MRRISVSFYDEIYEKMEKRSSKKNLASVAQSIRELVDLGLKVEEAATDSSEDNEENSLSALLSEIKNLLKNNLIWSLETRLLSRFLVENTSEVESAKAIEVLGKYKEKAQNMINGMLHELED